MSDIITADNLTDEQIRALEADPESLRDRSFYSIRLRCKQALYDESLAMRRFARAACADWINARAKAVR